MPRCCKPALNSLFGSTVEWAYFKKFRPHSMCCSFLELIQVTYRNLNEHNVYISAIMDPELFELVGSGYELIDQDPRPDPT
jgi:hypothetical protein